MADKMIGFVGIGNMGWPMASNIFRGGHPLIVHDVDRDRAVRFNTEHKDAKHAATLKELGQAADVVITMLPDGKAVRSVMLEDEDGGLVQSLSTGSLLIGMSSSDPIGTRVLGDELKKYGIHFVDAPVSGGVSGAREATLSIMTGSDDKVALEKAMPLLKLLGKRLFETGPLGSGHAMKSLNNYVASAGFAAASEALIIGEKFGLDPSVMVEILNASTGRNFSTEHSIEPHVIGREFATGFALALLAKDVKIAADLADGLGLNMPFSRLTREQFLAASDNLGPGRDFTEAFLYIKDSADTGR